MTRRENKIQINKFTAEKFRNIDSLELTSKPGINAIIGKNAAGKTNIIEGIWLFSGNRSFRLKSDEGLIKIGEDNAFLSLDFMSGQRNQRAEISISPKRTSKLNGLPLKSSSELLDTVKTVIFVPSHLGLIKDGPEERRAFVDNAVSGVKPYYEALMRNYRKALLQRNALLKDIQERHELRDFIFAFDHNVVKYGARIISMRKNYIKRLNESAAACYLGFTGGKESISVIYDSSVEQGDDLEKSFLKKLEENISYDIKMGSTSVGPHRDDLYIEIDGKSAKMYASQGQQRSGVLSLKLAECTILSEAFGENPIILLDDVMSELDAERRGYLIDNIKGYQVFITGTDKSLLPEKTSVIEL